MDFPSSISFTLTNRCNLRCRMCGQWSEEGYMHDRADQIKQTEMGLADWKRLVDEIAVHGVNSILLRGGETFLFPGVIELIEHIHSKGIFVAIDTNGTQIKNVAADLLRIGNIHITVSVDGPEPIHDQVRGVKGTFQQVRESMAVLHDLEASTGSKISQSICFTISRYSYRGLGVMPEVARSLGIGVVAIVPYYYVPAAVGARYAAELQEYFNCPAYTWVGFHHEDSGVDPQEFLAQFRQYQATLNGIYSYPYMPLNEEQYTTWFSDPQAPVGPLACSNVEHHVDIQPDGRANFCVDFPDYSYGNVRQATIEDLWNSEAARRFRDYRRKQPLAVCYRCGAKYMST
jgi:MoaA/NifB/PqqE/SkfB family radical SAM enzyme